MLCVKCVKLSYDVKLNCTCRKKKRILAFIWPLFVCLFVYLFTCQKLSQKRKVKLLRSEEGRVFCPSAQRNAGKHHPNQTFTCTSLIHLHLCRDGLKQMNWLIHENGTVCVFHFPCVKEKTEAESKQLRVWTKRILDVCTNASVTYLHAGLLKLFWNVFISALGENHRFGISLIPSTNGWTRDRTRTTRVTSYCSLWKKKGQTGGKMERWWRKKEVSMSPFCK